MAIPALPLEAFSGGARISDGFLQSYLQAVADEVANVGALVGSTPGTVIVSSGASLPAPSGGFHPLATDTLYRFLPGVVLTNGLDIPNNTVVEGISTFFRDVITFSGVPVAIRISSAAANVSIRNIGIVTAATLFDVTVDTLIIDLCRFIVGTIGTVSMTNALVMRTSAIVGFGVGLSFTGTNGVLSVDGVQFFQTTGGAGNKCIDLGTAILGGINIASSQVIAAAGGIGLSGLVGSGNIPSGRGLIGSSLFNGAGTKLENITIDDIRWQFLAVEGLLSSRIEGAFAQTGGLTALTIDGATKLLITTAVVSQRRIEHTANNELTFRAIQDQPAAAVVCIGVEKSGATTAIDFGVAVNGVIVDRVVGFEVSTQRALVSCTFALPVLTATDTIELYAEASPSVGISVIGATLRVRP